MSRPAEPSAPAVPAAPSPRSIPAARAGTLLLALGALTVGAAGAGAQQPAGSGFQLVVPADTILVPPERFTFGVRAGVEVRVVATVAPLDAPAMPAWRSDTLRVGTGARVAWDLHDATGRWVAPGRYMLRVVAFDSTGAAATAERALDVVRLPADSVPLPAPPGPRELLPETVQVRQTSPWAILIGGAAGLLPQLVGRHELNGGRSGDPKAWIVVGSVTAVGFLAIFTGHHPAYSRENVQSNAQLLADYRARLAEAEAANARARESAGFHIRAGAAP